MAQSYSRGIGLRAWSGGHLLLQPLVDQQKLGIGLRVLSGGHLLLQLLVDLQAHVADSRDALPQMVQVVLLLPAPARALE